MSFDYPFCQFKKGDQEALAKLCAKVKRKSLVFCEVGAWTGCSTAILAACAKKNKGLVYVVDWFKGSCKTALEGAANKEDIFSMFKGNMETLGLQDNICVFNTSSQRAVQIIRDEMFDLVFIDGNHIYPHIKEDLEIWLPKVKKGGIFCGHDCETIPGKVPYDINDFLDEDYHQGMHPGVIKAVFEKFPKVRIESTIWWIRV